METYKDNIKKIFLFVTNLLIIFLAGCLQTGNKTTPEKIESRWPSRAGNVEIFSQDFPGFLYYDPKQDLVEHFTLEYRNTIYLEEGEKINLNITSIAANVGEINCENVVNRIIQLYPPDYDYTSGSLYESTGTVSTCEIKIPKGYENLKEFVIIISYKLENIKTKVRIPLKIRYGPVGSSIKNTITANYLSSPVVPTSVVEEIHGVATYRVTIKIDDIYGCLYDNQKKHKIRIDNIKVNIDGRLMDLNNVNWMKCNLEVGYERQTPLEIICTIDMKELINQGLASEQLLSSEHKYAELEVEYSYNCYYTTRLTAKVMYT